MYAWAAIKSVPDETRSDRVAAGLRGRRRSLRGVEQHGLAAQAEAQFVRQILLSGCFCMLSERPDTFQPEREGRSLHGQVFGATPETCRELSRG